MLFAELWVPVRIIKVIWFKYWCTRSIEKSLLWNLRLAFSAMLTVVDEMKLRL